MQPINTQLLSALWKSNTSQSFLLVQLSEQRAKRFVKVPYVGLQRNRDSNKPHCSSYACSNITLKDSIGKLSFCYPSNRPELKQWSSRSVGTVTDTERMPDDRIGLI